MVDETLSNEDGCVPANPKGHGDGTSGCACGRPDVAHGWLLNTPIPDEKTEAESISVTCQDPQLIRDEARI